MMGRFIEVFGRSTIPYTGSSINAERGSGDARAADIGH